MARVISSLAISVSFVLACSSSPVGRTHLADGSYKLECKKPLADCLAELADGVCDAYGYDIVQGKEQVERYGVEPVNSVVVTSDAVVRCRSSSALLGGKPATSAAVANSLAPSAARCFPGATQVCLGPGACKGAQTCASDGARFGACDCGGAAPAPSGAATASGPLDTMAQPAPDGGAP